MSSILKVDQLQDSGGNNLVTSNGSGVITAAGFGKVGQVVSATNSTQQTTTTTGSYVASTGLTLSITPTSTSSKILVSIMSNIRSSNDATYTLYRDSTNLSGDNGFVQIYANNNDIRQLMTINYLDSPSTTSATTYTLYFKAGAGTAYINQEGGRQGQIILQEILP
tara:strand:- start:36 stop:533 length:498 start_codon:yes stop_codon:yes gene_type:complete